MNGDVKKLWLNHEQGGIARDLEFMISYSLKLMSLVV